MPAKSAASMKAAPDKRNGKQKRLCATTSVILAGLVRWKRNQPPPPEDLLKRKKKPDEDQFRKLEEESQQRKRTLGERLCAFGSDVSAAMHLQLPEPMVKPFAANGG